jgi:hypothetical protein
MQAGKFNVNQKSCGFAAAQACVGPRSFRSTVSPAGAILAGLGRQGAAMTRYLFAAIALSAIVPTQALPAAPVDCAALISGHIAWMAADKLHRRIGAKFARVKITSAATAPSTTKWGHISASEGAFGWSGDFMQGRFMVAFSDRNNFDPSRRDITDITLWKTGRAQVFLASWNTVLPLSDVRCDSAGFLTGMEHEGNGTSLVTLSFRRETFMWR